MIIIKESYYFQKDILKRLDHNEVKKETNHFSGIYKKLGCGSFIWIELEISRVELKYTIFETY